jgi:transcriptional regulator with XRE-family HTH domain
MRNKQLREQKGWTQEALADKAGLSSRYIARLEIGCHDPSLSTLVKLPEAPKMTAGELVE